MKNTLLLVPLLFFPFALTATPEKNTPGIIHLTVNIHNKSENSNSSVFDAPHVEQRHEVSAPTFTFSDLFSGDSLHSLRNSIQKNGRRYWWQLIGGTLALSYATICALLYRGNSYMDNKELWSSWRYDLPLEKLLALSQQDFAHELLREIKRRFKDTNDLWHSLTAFLSQVEKEEEMLVWHYQLYEWLLYIRLVKIVPNNVSNYAKIPERLARLAYYKNTFKTWLSSIETPASLESPVRFDPSTH